MSDAKTIAQKMVEEAKRAGAAQAEAYVQDGRQVQVTVTDGHVDVLREAHTRGGGLRVFVDQKLGFVYSSDFRPDAIRDLAKRAVTLAKFGLADEHAGIPAKDWLAKGGDSSLALFDKSITELTTEKRIAMALAMEKAALGVDPRVKRTQGCGVTSFAGTNALANTHGSQMEFDGTTMSMFVTALAEDAGGKQQGWGEGGAWRSLAELPNPEELGQDKLGQTIASPKVTLVDDGRREKGPGSRPFDGEGVPTRRTVLIDAGVCKNFLYDSYSARRAGVQSTGNAQRGYSNVPGIGTHNLWTREPSATTRRRASTRSKPPVSGSRTAPSLIRWTRSRWLRRRSTC
jgi:PmbA protein